MTLKSFSQQDEEERAFSEAMVDVMENLSSIADFIPALDFLARRGRKMVVSNCRNVEDYAKRVCSLLFLLLLSLLPFLSTFPFLLTNVSGDQKERDGAAFGASWPFGFVDDRNEEQPWLHRRGTIVHVERRMFFYFALFSSLMVLTHSTDAVCCHSDCLGHTGLDASVPLCPSRHARQVSQRDQRPTSWQNSHRSISHSILLSFFSFFFFFVHLFKFKNRTTKLYCLISTPW